MRSTVKSTKGTVFLVLLLVFSASAAVIKVAKTGGDFSTIQAAINSSIIGEVIMITDAETYREQVTIDSSKNYLTLTSKSPTSLKKPTIYFRDNVNVGPRFR
jgi:pectin methylesterase-like acyl-CoA thioesterase